MKSEILKDVPHEFFGRSSGSSKGYYSSLNCGKFVGDNQKDVEANLQYVKSVLHFDRIVLLEQVHGRDCLVVEENTVSDLKYDAMVTKIPGIALGIVTADCVPALFYDDKKQIIGAAHAGWKGAVAGVLESTIEKMIELGSIESDIKVAIGPCIHHESYEVQQDFVAEVTNGDDCFIYIEGRIFFDMPKYCCNRLLKAGICSKNIDVIPVDTYKNHDLYFSFRYARANSDGICGRNLSSIHLNH